MEELSLMQKFADPALIGQMSAAEKTVGSLVTMMMGMGITFVVLILLWGCINLLTKVLDYKDKKHEDSGKVLDAVVQHAAPKAAPTAAAAAAPEEDDSELVAVIMAAVAASSGRAVSELVISRIRRVKGNSTSWSQAGSSDSIASRRF